MEVLDTKQKYLTYNEVRALLSKYKLAKQLKVKKFTTFNMGKIDALRPPSLQSLIGTPLPWGCWVLGLVVYLGRLEL